MRKLVRKLMRKLTRKLMRKLTRKLTRKLVDDVTADSKLHQHAVWYMPGGPRWIDWRL